MHAFKGDEFQNLTRKMFCVDKKGPADCDAMEEKNASVADYMKALHSQSERQWRDVAQQTARMWLEYRDLSAEILANVREPTLVVSGDRDELIPLAHTLDIHGWLPDSELAILPGQDHAGPLTSPANLAQAVIDFVDRH
jgi:pimeloyl-ACP methyl ester carboxylesterase